LPVTLSHSLTRSRSTHLDAIPNVV
jgi:hypothetical protein